MDYLAELQIMLDDENLEFEDWISRYPIQECPRLILEYKNYMQKYFIENDDYESIGELQELDKFADYVENLAIEKLAEQQEKFNEATMLLEKIKCLQAQIMKSGTGEIPVSDELLNDLRDIVQYLKSQNMYNEETWKPLLHLI